MRGVLVVLTLTACGRVGFDAIGTGGGGGGSGQGEAGAGPGDSSGGGACDMAACAGVGGTCVGGQCVINVSTAGPLTCPPGLDCVFNCNVANACAAGIDCSMAAHCAIDCKVANTCMGAIKCQGGGCDMYCQTSSTCDNLMFTCGGKTCDVQCCNGGNLQCSGVSGGMLKLPGTCP